VDMVEACYRSQAARLWRAMVLFTGDREIASDAVSEAFAQALRRGGAVRDLDAWVWRAAYKIAGGEMQRLRRHSPEVDRVTEMPASLVDLVAALRQLSPKQRGAVILHHYAGYSTKQTARILGSTSSAVTVHLDRARRRLREAMEDSDA
jgi:RNA polymerase sigma-70 factor, ECF subfamily